MKMIFFGLVFFSYLTSAVLFGMSVAVVPYVGDGTLQNIAGNDFTISQPTQDFIGEDAVIGRFNSSLNDNLQQCTIDTNGNQVCVDAQIGDAFFGISPLSISTLIGLVSGTLMFQLLALVGISQIWILVMELSLGVVYAFGIWGMLTGRW